MRYVVWLILALSAFAAADQPCVILKRASTGEHVWSGIEFQYVSGEYPMGFKFRENLRGRDFRKLHDMGANVQILETNYTSADLEKAKATCAGGQPQSAK
jgi:hypothetical protein